MDVPYVSTCLKHDKKNNERKKRERASEREKIESKRERRKQRQREEIEKHTSIAQIIFLQCP